MAITPGYGYIIDPNNPNAVIRDPNIGTAPGGIPIGATAPSIAYGAVNTPISTASLAPAKSISIPSAPVDTTNYQAILNGAQAQAQAIQQGIDNLTKQSTPAPAPTPAPTDTTSPMQKLLDSIKSYFPKAPQSSTDAYNAAYNSLGIDQATQDYNAKQAAVKAAQSKLTGIQAKIAALNAEGQAQNLAVENQGGAVTTRGVANQQQANSREIAIRALPLQAEALAAQAEIASAQGDAQLAQSILAQAQDRINTTFQLQQKDAENQYKYEMDLYKSIYDAATKEQQAQLDQKKLEATQNFQIQQTAIDQANKVAALALQNGQSDVYAAITALNPNDPQYSQKVAELGVRVSIQKETKSTEADKPLSILDIQRYQELYPEAGIIAGDTESTANNKVAQINTPEAKIRTLVVAAKDANNDYTTVVNEINNDSTIKDKAMAIKIADEVYGKTTTAPLSKIEQEIAQIKSNPRNVLNDSDIRELLRNKYSPQEIANSSVGNIMEKISAFLFR